MHTHFNLKTFAITIDCSDDRFCTCIHRHANMEHTIKVVERIFEHRIRQQIKIDDMQFGFMKGKGTTDAIFMARQLQENFRVKGKKLYFGFVDLDLDLPSVL